MSTATYVYCLVANGPRPRVRRGLPGLPHGGPIRLVDAGRKQWLVVSDVPLEEYGEAALKKGLADIDWVGEIAVAHERVVEAFLGADAVLPMKLFTMFASDVRAVEHVVRTRPAVDGLIARVSRREEWGIRVALDRSVPVPPAGTPTARRRRAPSGTGSTYLLQKKSQRDAAKHRAERARAVANELYEALARHASEACRRPATELAAGGGTLVLDAAFLVPRSASPRLKAAAARHARALTPEGYAVSLTGPWPPYSFMQA